MRINIQTVKQDCLIAQKIASELRNQGFQARCWQKGDATPRVYVEGSGGCKGYLEIQGYKVHPNLTGYGKSGLAWQIARSICGES